MSFGGQMLKKKFTILDHELVPKHILLTKEERKQLLEQLKIKPEQLPWIRASDPVAKLIGAKPGDIVKIIRKSPTAGETIAYRFVVP
ncbi:MAG: DNA-directed RNA polymerase subunit H [Candidatus Nezhaarchaeales archaeon]